MTAKRIGRPNHATVIAYLALFIALSGTAIAAKKIGSSQIKKAAVKEKKIATGAVTTNKLADAAVTEPKLANDAVTTSKMVKNAITQGKLADDSVGTAQLLADSVGNNKLKPSSVTGPKVEDGSLGLTKVAAIVQTATVTPEDFPEAGCGGSADVAVPGMQAGDSVLVLPKPDANSVPTLAPLAGSIDPANDMVKVVFCGAALDPGGQRVTIAVFR